MIKDLKKKKIKKNLLDRIERKLIVANTFFIEKGVPRIPEHGGEIDLSFSGMDPVSMMDGSSKKIFAGFDSSTSVLIKISINSPNPYPATTSREMLESVLRSLRDLGVKKICVGDCSGLVHLPTRKVIRKKGFDFLKKYGARVSVFDYGGWVSIPVNGIYFKNIILSKSIYKYDKIINISNLKSHWRAGFTFSTKSLVGFMHPRQRRALHRDHLEERIAELSLAVSPDINIIDGRKIFIEGGPDEGRVAVADTIFVNSDLMKADLKSYGLLFGTRKKNGILNMDEDPYSNNFFKHFLKIRGIKR